MLMIRSRRIPVSAFGVANTLLMVLLMGATVYPFLYVLFASVSEPVRIVAHRGVLVHPLGFNPRSYALVFENPMILRGYLNTVLYLFAGTTVNMLMTSLGAYVLSRKNVYWKSTIMFLVAFTMFFSGGLIPYYLVVKGLGLVDRIWALVLPTAISTYNLIIMRTYFQGIPAGMEESAKMDGAGDFTVLFRIVLPLSMPVVAVMILFYGVYHWNSWFPAMVFLRSRERYPLQLILREILVASSTDNMTVAVDNLSKEPLSETIKYATIIVATVPILLVYPLLQKYFVQGVMIGALKG